MDSIDLTALERRARRGYELRRVRQALVGMAPLAFIVPLAACLSQHPSSAWAFGLATFAVGGVMLWFGRDPQKAVLPGLALGLVPLLLALCANRMHYCGPNGCASLCVPACTLGGLLAGLGVARIGHQRHAGVRYWLSASTVAMLTGAMGCSCVGYAGIVGLAAGFGVGVVPSLVRAARSKGHTR